MPLSKLNLLLVLFLDLSSRLFGEQLSLCQLVKFVENTVKIIDITYFLQLPVDCGLDVFQETLLLF